MVGVKLPPFVVKETNSKMLIVNMITKDEADRYLKQVIEHTWNFADEIVITDDHSTDNTVEIAESLGCKVHEADDDISFILDESELREQSLRTMEQYVEPNAWVLSLDADEILWGYTNLKELMDQKIFDVLGITFFHTWKSPHLVRVDKAWTPNISSRLYRYYPGGEYVKRKLACGAEPSYVRELVRQGKIMWHTPLVMEHLGYLRDQDKIAKYKRYKELDGGAYHNGSHIDSILDSQVQLLDISHLCKP